MWRNTSEHNSHKESRLIDKCVYVRTDEPPLNSEPHYKCRKCGDERYSRHPPEYLHNPCIDSSQQTQQTPGNIRTRLSRYKKALAKWKAAGKPVRTDAEVLYILETKCQPCDHFRNGKCGLCGCKLNIGKNARFNKIRMATEGCPDSPAKWVVDPEALPEFASAVLDAILDGVDRGRDIRERINAGKFFKMSERTFQKRMAEMGADGLVVGKYHLDNGVFTYPIYELPEVNDET